MDNVELLNGLQEIYHKPFIQNLKNTIRDYPDVDFSDALSFDQIISNNWLIDWLHWETCDGYLPGNGMIFIVGGRYGILAAMMFEGRKYIFSNTNGFSKMKIRSFDIDPVCAPIADSINKNPWVDEGWQFKASTQDMYQINYRGHHYKTLKGDGTPIELYEIPDVVINMSCEDDFNRWWNLIPTGILCVLQTNYFESLDQFLEATSMTQIRYADEKYKRFMIIGEK